MISEELKTYDTNHTRFQYKFYPLPLNPHMLKSKKKKSPDLALYQRRDGVSLHNAMSVIFHPFLVGYENNRPGGAQIWYKAL
jgi:hypothetical protein